MFDTMVLRWYDALEVKLWSRSESKSIPTPKPNVGLS